MIQFMQDFSIKLEYLTRRFHQFAPLLGRSLFIPGAC